MLNETQQDPTFPASALALDTPNENMEARHVSTITSLVMTDSASGYMHVTPLRNKNQWSMVQEFLTFAGVFGICRVDLQVRQRTHVVTTAALCDQCKEINGFGDTKARHHRTHIPLVWLKMLWAESGRLLGPSHGRTACSLIFKQQSLVLGAQTCGMARQQICP